MQHVHFYNQAWYWVTNKKPENYVTLKVVALHMLKTCPARGEAAARC